ncbi:MAG: hypothetical protein ACLT98_15550 [Eggerthellaceae bacterium]
MARSIPSALSAIETKDAQYVAAERHRPYAALGQNVDVQSGDARQGGYGVAVAADNADLQKAVSISSRPFPQRRRLDDLLEMARLCARPFRPAVIESPSSASPGPRRLRPRARRRLKRRTDLLHPPTTSRSRPMKMWGRTPCFLVASSRARRMRLLRESARGTGGLAA